MSIDEDSFRERKQRTLVRPVPVERELSVRTDCHSVELRVLTVQGSIWVLPQLCCPFLPLVRFLSILCLLGAFGVPSSLRWRWCFRWSFSQLASISSCSAFSECLFVGALATSLATTLAFLWRLLVRPEVRVNCTDLVAVPTTLLTCVQLRLVVQCGHKSALVELGSFEPLSDVDALQLHDGNVRSSVLDQLVRNVVDSEVEHVWVARTMFK